MSCGQRQSGGLPIMPPGHLDLPVLSGTQPRIREFHVIFDGQRQLGGVPIMPPGHARAGAPPLLTQRR